MEMYDSSLSVVPPAKKRRELEIQKNKEQVSSTLSPINVGSWPQPQSMTFHTDSKEAPAVVEKKTRNVGIMTNLMPNTSRISSHSRKYRSDKGLRKEKGTQFLFRGASTLSDAEMSSSPAFSTPMFEVVEETYSEYETAAENSEDDDQYETIDGESDATTQRANCESTAAHKGEEEITPIFSGPNTTFSSATDKASFDLNDYLAQLADQANEADIMLDTESNNSGASTSQTPELSTTTTHVVEEVTSAPATLEGNEMKPVLTSAVAGMSLKSKVSFFKKVLGLFRKTNKDMCELEKSEASGIHIDGDEVLKVKSSTKKKNNNKRSSGGLFSNSQRESETVGMTESGNNNPSPSSAQAADSEGENKELTIKHVDSLTLMKNRRQQFASETRELCRLTQIRFATPISKMGTKLSRHSTLRRVQSMIEESSSGVRIEEEAPHPQSIGSTTSASVSHLSDSVIFAIKPPPPSQPL